MTFQKIASELCKREGRKSQAKIHDVRELLRALVEWDASLNLGELDSAPITHLEALANQARQKRLDREAKQAAKQAKKQAESKP